MSRRPRPVWVALALVLLAGCGGNAATTAATIETVSPAEAMALLDDPPSGLVILDVRTPDEFAAGHLPGAVNLDFQSAGFAADLGSLDRAVPYLMYCRSGNRSAQVRQMMSDLGFTEVYEIAGGIVAWAGAGGSVVAP